MNSPKKSYINESFSLFNDFTQLRIYTFIFMKYAYQISLELSNISIHTIMTKL